MLKKTLIAACIVLATTSMAEDTELDCLAKTIYHEARGEPAEGKVAVALVVLNRVNHSKYPNSICNNVYAKHQFSWTKNEKQLMSRSNATGSAGQQLASAKQLARYVITNYEELRKFKATHFHNLSVNPNWKGLKYLKTIGNHKFYVSN